MSSLKAGFSWHKSFIVISLTVGILTIHSTSIQEVNPWRATSNCKCPAPDKHSLPVGSLKPLTEKAKPIRRWGRKATDLNIPPLSLFLSILLLKDSPAMGRDRVWHRKSHATQAIWYWQCQTICDNFLNRLILLLLSWCCGTTQLWSNTESFKWQNLWTLTRSRRPGFPYWNKINVLANFGPSSFLLTILFCPIFRCPDYMTPVHFLFANISEGLIVWGNGDREIFWRVLIPAMDIARWSYFKPRGENLCPSTNSNVKIATMFLSPCVFPVTEMATSPALHAEEKRAKNCYQLLHASLPVQLIVSRGVKLLPIVPVVPAVDLTPLVLPAADFPEAVSLLQPEAVSNIRAY